MVRRLFDKFVPIAIVIAILVGIVFLFWGFYLWTMVVFGLATFFILLIVLNDSNLIKKADKKKLSEIERQKKYWTKIPINLNEVEILTNSWHEEIVFNNTKSGALNQLFGRGDLNIEVLSRNENSILIQAPFKGKKLKIIQDISLDIKTLRMKFAIQKETFLYLNSEKQNEFYLDLEFLE